MAIKIQLRRDVAANWNSNNPILSAGEFAISTDLNQIKIGNGTDTWSILPYINALPASPTFTGTPTAPTASIDTNTTQIATTAFVINQGYLKSSTASSTYAALAGATFTGTVIVPTPTLGTHAANKSYVDVAVGSAGFNPFLLAGM